MNTLNELRVREPLQVGLEKFQLLISFYLLDFLSTSGSTICWAKRLKFAQIKPKPTWMDYTKTKTLRASQKYVRSWQNATQPLYHNNNNARVMWEMCLKMTKSGKFAILIELEGALSPIPWPGDLTLDCPWGHNSPLGAQLLDALPHSTQSRLKHNQVLFLDTHIVL